MNVRRSNTAAPLLHRPVSYTSFHTLECLQVYRCMISNTSNREVAGVVWFLVNKLKKRLQFKILYVEGEINLIYLKNVRS